MKENSVFFPLTNPRQRLDTGRRLAGVETRLQNPKTTADFPHTRVHLANISSTLLSPLSCSG